jgi:uncharacterized protein YdbL (DUF1318 family)
VNANQELPDKFVWRTAGQKVYASLLGTYLMPPHWTVRFARFTGEVSERAEEYIVCISTEGEAYRFIHDLPESRPGENLDQAQAKALADAEVQALYRLAPGSLKDVSAVPQKHPSRTDWLFTYADEASYHENQGQARIEVKVAGSMISESKRYVHVPEEWERKEKNQETTGQILNVICKLIIVVLVLGAVGLAVLGWTRKQFAPRVFLQVAVFLFILKLLGLALSWPALIANFETATPFSAQVLLSVGLPVIGILFVAAGLGLMAGFAHGRLARIQGPGRFPWAAMLWGAFGVGILSLAQTMGLKLEAHWPTYEPVTTWVPFLSAAIGFLSRFFNFAILWMLVVASIDWMTRGWQRLRFMALVLLVLLAFLIAGVSMAESLTLWFTSGLAIALFLVLSQVLVLSTEPSALPWLVAGMLILSAASTVVHRSYPGAAVGGILGIALIAWAAWYWHRALICER